MIKFSANLGLLWPGLPLLERLQRAGAAGFKAVEMHWPYECPPGSVREICSEFGMSIGSINTAPGDRSKGEFGLGALPGREDDFQASVDQAIAYCLASGASAIHCMAGNVGAQQRDEARGTLIRNMQIASKKAEAAGIRCLLEPINSFDQPDYLYSTVEEVAFIIEAIDSTNVQILFDAYHVARSQGDVTMRLRQFINRIGHVQIASVPSRAEPTDGEIDYRFFLSELNFLNYSGLVGLEYNPSGNTECGLESVKLLAACMSY